MTPSHSDRPGRAEAARHRDAGRVASQPGRDSRRARDHYPSRATTWRQPCATAHADHPFACIRTRPRPAIRNPRRSAGICAGAGHDLTWAQRTPASAAALAHELAAAPDQRARALGDQAAAVPEPWLAHQLGVLSPGASPALREEYARRAGVAAAYREAAGITRPDQAISPNPHLADPELETMRAATIRALEFRDEADIIRGMTRGELEAQVLDGERAQASAPPDVSSQLRLTAQAEANTLAQSADAQSADAQARHDHAAAASAMALARQVRHREREEQPVNIILKSAGQDPVRGEPIPGQARPDQPATLNTERNRKALIVKDPGRCLALNFVTTISAYSRALPPVASPRR